MSGGPVLIYIGPFGFSGSTLLDMALAQSSGTVTLGEAFQIADWMRGDRLCTCRAPLSACAFWAPLLAGRSPDGLATPAAALRRGENYRAAALPADPALESHARRHWALIDAAAEATGAGWAIDSSKHLWRLKALAALRPGQVRFVHLVRDADAVARSGMRPKASPAVGAGVATPAVPYGRTLAKWVAANAAAARFARAAGIPRRRVVYERLVAAPEAEMRALAGWLGLPWAASMTAPRLDGLHNIAGSRWRMTRRAATIAPDDGPASGGAGAAAGRLAAAAARLLGDRDD